MVSIACLLLTACSLRQKDGYLNMCGADTIINIMSCKYNYCFILIWYLSIVKGEANICREMSSIKLRWNKTRACSCLCNCLTITKQRKVYPIPHCFLGYSLLFLADKILPLQISRCTFKKSWNLFFLKFITRFFCFWIKLELSTKVRITCEMATVTVVAKDSIAIVIVNWYCWNSASDYLAQWKRQRSILPLNTSLTEKHS